MPNRLLKEGICTSDAINDLSPEEEVLFYRLLVICDDYGHADARPAIIKAQCFPLKDNATTAKVNDWINGLSAKKMIRKYKVEGKLYLAVNKWEHRIRTNPKHPIPDPDGSQWVDEPEPVAADPLQAADDLRQIAADCGTGLGLGKGWGKGKGEGIKHTESETPSPEPEPEKPVCVISPSTEQITPSVSGMCCKAIRDQGIPTTNALNPTFMALIKAGATADEFSYAARDAVAKGHSDFGYVVGIVKRQREQAAKLVLHHGRMPNKQELLEESNRAATAGWMPPELRGIKNAH